MVEGKKDEYLINCFNKVNAVNMLVNVDIEIVEEGAYSSNDFLEELKMLSAKIVLEKNSNNIYDCSNLIVLYFFICLTYLIQLLTNIF